MSPDHARNQGSDDKVKLSPYHQLLNTPAAELTDKQKRSQLSGAIHWRNEARIDELLSVDTVFLSKPAKYASRTWLAEAVYSDCGISIFEKLLAAGCDPNAYLKSPKESRPLEIAIDKDNLDAVAWLLANDANPNLGRPIVGAVNHEKSPETQLELLRMLLDGGANVNQTFPLFGDEDNQFTVLDWAELYEVSASVRQFLVARGATHNWTSETIRESKGELKTRRIV
ncbi:hypothetical protein RBSWK_03543 [Rhodopirellula baltica SWK14]|uniref:Uncharacterized protein n=1 Tax=Rhodopirellula baltica SWK14 TaxID=993516 RepID=L7CFC7_RHOBT|nr:hypothetical protein RBSWK_03543 [Rhodopirellula baltica SWK14]